MNFKVKVHQCQIVPPIQSRLQGRHHCWKWTIKTFVFTSHQDFAGMSDCQTRQNWNFLVRLFSSLFTNFFSWHKRWVRGLLQTFLHALIQVKWLSLSNSFVQIHSFALATFRNERKWLSFIEMHPLQHAGVWQWEPELWGDLQLPAWRHWGNPELQLP